MPWWAAIGPVSRKESSQSQRCRRRVWQVLDVLYPRLTIRAREWGFDPYLPREFGGFGLPARRGSLDRGRASGFWGAGLRALVYGRKCPYPLPSTFWVPSLNKGRKHVDSIMKESSWSRAGRWGGCLPGYNLVGDLRSGPTRL